MSIQNAAQNISEQFPLRPPVPQSGATRGGVVLLGLDAVPHPFQSSREKVLPLLRRDGGGGVSAPAVSPTFFNRSHLNLAVLGDLRCNACRPSPRVEQ